MVLITGATGLVGSHLALHLIEKGESVRAIYRNKDAIEKTKSLFALHKKSELFESIEWVEADITEIPSLETTFENIEYVYHCAAFISFDSSKEDQLRKINIEGTANIVNFCILNQIKKLCYVSSIAALGDLKDFEFIVTEETEWNPERHHSDYAISKYGAEMEIWRRQQEGLEVVILNPGVILGPGFPNQGSGEIFTKIKNGFPFYTEGITGFVAITDVVQLLHKAMKSNNSGERFIVIAENLSLNIVFNSVAEALKVKKPNVYASSGITGVAWRLDWILGLLRLKNRTLFRDTAIAAHSKIRYSNEKVKKVFDYKFRDIKQYIVELEKEKWI